METNTAAITKWTVDPFHSEVHFKIRHLLISTVTGTFKTFSGNATSAGADFENADINFTIEVQSIDTGQEMRDNHLKQNEFFDAATYPTITFQSTSVKKVNGDDYKLAGNLTLRGVTKLVELNVTYGGTMKDQRGSTKAGFEVTGVINRTNFGLSYNALTETGGLALGEDIKISASIQLTKGE